MLDNLLAWPDRWLNAITMYRLVLYYLGGLLAIALLQSLAGVLHYPPTALAGTALLAVAACWSTNYIFARVFAAPVNSDSALITGLILALIVGPAQSPDEYVALGWAAILAIASKYILARHNVHLFNPAAAGVVATGLFVGQSASWWVGTASLAPWVIGGGLLLVRRLHRGDLVWSFLWTTIAVQLVWSAVLGNPLTQAVPQLVLSSPIWFLAFVMLTEPVTVPPTTRWQLPYGALAGLLVVPQVHLGAFYFSPELALVIANICAYPVRSRRKLQLRLARAAVIGPGLMEFAYRPARRLAFQPGQYMEWTLDHGRADSRGKRRFFTLASSPTEPLLRIGVKFTGAGSTFKRALATHGQPGSSIIAAQVAGDFTLPRDTDRKLAFIAGGIGVTPFRSMVKYLTDRREQRDVILLYANRAYDEILYRDVFWQAMYAFRFRPVYVVSDGASVPPGWTGEVGRIDTELIQRQVPDYRERLFYVSGSPLLVQRVQRALYDLGVKPEQIRTDAFSGLGA